MPATRSRDYDAIVHELTLTGDRSMRMHALVDILWRALAPTGVSWIGFYLRPAEGDHLVLGPRRDKPACSPIGMNGACGRSWTAKKSLVVTDVSHLGSGYIACDPKDRSEVVVPLIETTGHCWGVLDADSYETHAFSAADAAGLAHVVRAAGLTWRDPEGVEVV